MIPKLKRITPRALEALTANGNIGVPPRESLELVGEQRDPRPRRLLAAPRSSAISGSRPCANHAA